MWLERLACFDQGLETGENAWPAVRRGSITTIVLRPLVVHDRDASDLVPYLLKVYAQEKMTGIDKEKQKLIARIKRIRGQVDSIERSLTTGDDCADVLMLLANVRGGVNSLMAEVLEDHIRLHLLTSEKNSAPPHELAEDLIDLVRAYLK
jgi:DNA-binding FrmR family transcriptional regulator